jgi:tetratricopeptide (TPR) repeat protein
VLAVAETLSIRYPLEPEGHLLRADALVTAGRFLEAVEALDRVVRMDSAGLKGIGESCRACDALLTRAHAYRMADSLAAAEASLRTLLRHRPRYAEAWSTLAQHLLAAGRHREAIQAHERLQELRPDAARAQLFAAQCLIFLGSFERADALLRELAGNSDRQTREEALWYLTYSLRNQGRPEEAAEVARTVYRELRAAGNGALVDRMREAQMLREAGRFAEAAALFAARRARAGAGVGGASLSFALEADALAAAGDTARLAALADSLQRTAARSAYARDRRLHHHVRGLRLARAGALDSAAAAFRRATFSPVLGFPRTSVEAARALIGAGRPHQAIPLLRAALHGSFPTAGSYWTTRTELHELLGEAWDAAGRPDSAAVYYARVTGAWRRAEPSFAARRARVQIRLHRTLTLRAPAQRARPASGARQDGGAAR